MVKFIFKKVKTHTESVGVMGLMGNKGSISIRFEINESTVCFTNAHLAAKDKEVLKRNQNLNDILNKTKFNDENNNLLPGIINLFNQKN
jgi:inositol polyphosphate 5-phosphatase INPP5B/F